MSADHPEEIVEARADAEEDEPDFPPRAEPAVGRAPFPDQPGDEGAGRDHGAGAEQVEELGRWPAGVVHVSRSR